MEKLILKRVLSLIPTLLGISVLCFILVLVSPGDPAELLMRQSGGELTAAALEDFRRELGMDAPVHLRYIRWLQRAIRFDFGESFSSGEKVAAEILTRLPATMKLAAAAFAFMLILSLPVGILSALRQNLLFDNLSRLWSIISISIPSYWLGLLLLYFFGLKLKIFHVVGQGSLKDLVLPAVTLGLGMSAVYSRLLRERILDVFSQDYIKLAYTKGLSLWEIVFRHTLKNAILPLITLWGMSFGYLLGGSIIVESVFSWPGVGKFAVEAISNRDYPVIQCYVVLMALIFIGLNLFVDILYQFIDPRIRSGWEKQNE